jgi:TatA/E family protein of Tat protein translocase
MLNGIGTVEIVIIALVIFVLFGGKKIPQFVRGLGEAIREFRKSSSDK